MIAPCITSAQQTADTIYAAQLDEVVVEAPEIVRKSDMDVYFPSKSAVENSRNGVQLLNNLMIPALTVTEALGTISAAGESVQLRINGRESSVSQVKALLPETIKRVEWIDNPGLRYNGAGYVLNFIVANPAIGGSVQTEGRQALSTAWGDYFTDGKFNSGRSQFEIGGLFKLTNKVKSHRDYRETFTYPDGTSLTRTETPVKGRLDNSFGRLWSSYSYIRPDTTTFFIEASVDPTFNDDLMYKGLLSLSDGSDDINLTESSGNRGNTSRFSAYLEHNFARRQLCHIALTGTISSG